MVWAVAKGSLLNKAILVPLALAISAFAPWAVTPLLMVGGAFLCYEGFEKLAHRFLHSTRRRRGAACRAWRARWPTRRSTRWRSRRPRSRARSAPTSCCRPRSSPSRWARWPHAPFGTRVAVLVGIALLMTVGVYGFVAGIVKLDDAGLHLSRSAGADAWAGFKRALGGGILRAAPWLMKALSVAGTAAMFLVGGGILTHGVPALHHGIEAVAGSGRRGCRPGRCWPR